MKLVRNPNNKELLLLPDDETNISIGIPVQYSIYDLINQEELKDYLDKKMINFITANQTTPNKDTIVQMIVAGILRQLHNLKLDELLKLGV